MIGAFSEHTFKLLIFKKRLPSLAETQFCNFFSATHVLVCTYIAGFDENSDAADARSQIRDGETRRCIEGSQHDHGSVAGSLCLEESHDARMKELKIEF